MAGSSWLLLSLLLFCQGLLLISANTDSQEDGVKVEETDWLDISADLADVDDNTLDSQEIDENMVMFEDMQLNNNNDDDDDDDGGMMEFDDDNADNGEKHLDHNLAAVEGRKLCKPLTTSYLRRAVCRVEIPLLVKRANSLKIPDIRAGSFKFNKIDISKTRVGSCSVTGGRFRKMASLSGISTQITGRYHFKIGFITFKGSVHIRFSGAKLQMSFSHRNLHNGCPIPYNVRCSSSLPNVQIKVKGRLVSTIVNLFRGRIGRKIKGFLGPQVCKVAKIVLLRNGPNILRRLLST